MKLCIQTKNDICKNLKKRYLQLICLNFYKSHSPEVTAQLVKYSGVAIYKKLFKISRMKNKKNGHLKS